jgi:hypothetical protein
MKRILDIATEIAREEQINPWDTPYQFAEEVARRACEMHVANALIAADKAAKIIDDPYSYCGNTGSEYPPDQIIDRVAIANSYPLTNIQ